MVVSWLSVCQSGKHTRTTPREKPFQLICIEVDKHERWFEREAKVGRTSSGRVCEGSSGAIVGKVALPRWA